MDLSRLSRGLQIAGGGSIVLFITLFLGWYTTSFDDGGLALGDTSQSVSLWDASGFFAVLILICVLVIIGIVLATAAGSLPSLPVAPTVLVAGAGVLALVLAVIRVIFIPGAGDAEAFGFDVGRGFAAYLGLLAAIAAAAGGVMAMNESGNSFSAEADRLKGSGGSGGTAA